MGKVRLTSEYTVEKIKVQEQISEQTPAQTQNKSDEYMPGARVPGSSSEKAAGAEVANIEMSSFDGGNDDEVEEQKDSSTPLQPGEDDLMSGSEQDLTTLNKSGATAGTKDCIDYSSLPSIEQLLEQNGFGVKFG
jgi:hypothetical protein